MKSSGVPSVWPVFAGLALVALLLLAMLGTDLVVARGVAARTAEIVENAQRSIELVDDLRAQAHRLVAHGLAPEDVGVTWERIAVDSAAYDRLATSPGEREEWNNLRALLERLRAAAGAGAARARARGRHRGVDRQARPHQRQVGRRERRGHPRHPRRRHPRRHGRGRARLRARGASSRRCCGGCSGGSACSSRSTSRSSRSATATSTPSRAAPRTICACRSAPSAATPISSRSTSDAPPEVREMASRIQVAVGRMARVIDDMLELARVGPRGARARRAGRRRGARARGPARGARRRRGRRPSSRTTPWRARRASRADRPQPARERREVPLAAARAPHQDQDRATRRRGRAQSSRTTASAWTPRAPRHVFEPGYRAEAAREIPGHGLGLAIVERAVTAVGGTCQIFGSPEAGTSVVVRLPRVRVE